MVRIHINGKEAVKAIKTGMGAGVGLYYTAAAGSPSPRQAIVRSGFVLGSIFLVSLADAVQITERENREKASRKRRPRKR